jgi:flavin-binding protein dodecin
VLAEGDSIEAAVQLAVSEAAETMRGIKHVYYDVRSLRLREP